MPNNKSCVIVIILLSLTLLGLIYFWRSGSMPPPEIRLEDIPFTLGGWKGEDLPLSERTYELLETEDALMRVYTNGRGEKIYLAIVYSGVNRGSFHPPEICYLGGGTELLNKGFDKIEMNGPGKGSHAMEVNKLLMEDRLGKEIAWYWFTAGSRVISNYYLQQCYFVWDEIWRNRAGGSLIRVSIRAAGGDLKEADGQGKDFIREIAPILLSYLVHKKT